MAEQVTDLRATERAVPGWTIDYLADAAYLQINHQPIAETVSYGLINVDLDDQGRAVGIEFLTLDPLGQRDRE